MAPLFASVNRIAAEQAEQKAAHKLAQSARKQLSPQAALERALFVNPPPPVAPNISATLSDSFIDTNPADGRADAGSTVTYTAVISNAAGATDATNVSFTDTPDPNSTLIGGSVKMSPLALNDSYNATKNTQLVVTAGSGVLLNDTGTPAPTAVPIAAQPTAQAGTVTLNADGSFTYDPPNNFTGSDSFTYTATNGVAPPNPSDAMATVTITVTLPNNPPVLTAGATLNYTENDPATVIDNTITVNDSDSANLTGATAQITGNYQSTEDVLSFVTQNGISGSYNSANGTMTLSGSSSVANYQTALRAVKYNNTSENPSTVARTVTWIATDGITPSTGVTSTINVTAVNDAPVLANVEAGALAYTENDPATSVSSTITVNDVDSTNLTGATVQITGNYASTEDVLSFVTQNGISGSYNSANGTMTLSGSSSVANYQTALRAVKYNNTSDNPSTLVRTVTFQVNDGAALNNLSNTQTRNINVTSVNDAPVVTAGATLNYTENDPATVIDNTITVTDVDSTNLTGATVQITGNYASTEDVLSFVTQLGITGSYNSVNGKLTLSGTTTLANYQTALRAVKYNNTSENPSTLARTVTWIVNDGAAANNLSTGVTSTINVTAVNDAPVLAAIEAGALAYTENDPATSVSSTITVNDVDSTNLTGATVQITGNYQSAEDVLSFVNQLGITGSYNSANGTMTLTGTTTVANYQTALRAVKYNNTSDTPSTLARTVTFQVNDGGAVNNLSNTQTRNINVTAVNDAPVLANIEAAAVAYNENDPATAVTSTITVNDVDSPNLTGATVQITGNYASTEDVLSFVNQLGITGSYNSVNGTMTLSGTTTLANYQTALRAVKYNNTSENPSTLSRTVTFQVNDGAGVNNLSNTQTRNINVASINDAPLLANIEGGALAYTENAPATAVTSTITVSDVDSTNLAGATVQITGNYASTEDVLSFVTQNGISGSYNSANGTMTLSGSSSVANYQTALRAVKYNNTSDNPSTLTRTVTFQVNDGGAVNNLSNTQTRNITVTAVNDAPVLTAGATLSYTENDPATVIDNTITVNDVDSANLTGATAQITGNYASTEDVLSFVTQNGISGSYNSVNGTLTLTGTSTVANYQTALRSVMYNNTSESPSTLARTVTWIATDGINPSSGVTSTINVTSVNDAPVLANIEGSALAYTENDAPTSVTSTITVSDVDSANMTGATVQITGNYQSNQDVLSFVTQNGITGVYNSANGTLTLSGTTTKANYQTALRAVKYNNSSDDPSTLARTVTFQVNDGQAQNNLSNTQTRNINITAVNDPPTANGFSLLPAQAAIPITYPAGKLGGTDVEAGTTITIDTAPINVTNGTVTINGNGSFTFTPLPNVTTGSFQYRVMDNGNPPPGLNSAYVTVGFTVAGPAIYFVKSAAVGSGNCTLGNECTLATAVINIGAATNARIFIEDANNHNAAVPLNSGGWLIGQGVTGPTFDTFFGILAPAQGTLATRPSLGQTRPTVQNTVTLNTNSVVRGLNISSTSNTGMTDPGGAITGVTVSEIGVDTTSGTAVNLSNISGTLTFDKLATTSNGTGASLTGSNGSATFNFSAVSISITSGSNPGFVATGGGTVNVTGAGNTIVSTSGTALNVSNTTIGASGLTFQKISSDGAPNGIVLNNTGTSGGLTVTGNSSGNCGGSITVQPLGTPSTANAPVTADCTGGTIQNTTGYGVTLTNTKNVSLTRMLIENVANGFDEINAQTINGLTIDHSYITDNAGNAGDRGIEIGDFSTGTPVNGTITVSNSTIGTTPHDNIGIGIASGTSTWSFTNDVLTGSVLDSGMNFEVRNATVTSFLMDNCVVQNQFADGMQINPASGVSATITSATIQNSTFVANNLHIDLNHDGNSNVTYKVLNNTFRTNTAQAVNFFTSATAGTSGTANGRFVNNRIGIVGSSLSGGGAGFRINVNGGAAARVLLDSNVIRQEPNGRGIEIISRNGTGGTDATVTNNDVDTNFVSTPQNSGFSLSNIFLQSNCVGANGCNTLRSNITGNTVPAVAPTGELVAGQIALLQSSGAPNGGGSSTNQLVDNPPASANAAAELASQNTGSTATSGTITLIAGPINTPPLRFALGGVESALYAQSELSRFLWSSATPIHADANVTSRADVNSSSSASLDQRSLDSIVSAAINRWQATGLTASQIATLRGLKFEVTDLGGVFLGEASNGAVQIDRNAGGKGWYTGADSSSDLLFSRAVSNTRRYTDPLSVAAGHLDLLTAIEHEMGHKLGLSDSYAQKDRDNLMYGYLTVGERRLPAPGQAQFAKPSDSRGTQHLKLRSVASSSSQRASTLTRRSSKAAHTPFAPPPPPPSVNVTIGTLPAGKSVTITFQVTLHVPSGTNTISTQGTVTYDSGPPPIANFDGVNPGLGTDATLLTDDPKTLVVGDATVTPVDTPTAADSTVGGQILDSNGNPVEGAAVRMTGTQNRLTVTDAAGNYHFDNVETNGFYTIVPSRANFSFSPSQRAFSQLGQHTDALFSASSTGAGLNPLDTTEYFVRQQYVDFLNREPDESGFNFWVNNIESCGNDANCRAVKRTDTSAAFFLSIEFQQTGYLVYRTYQAAYGEMPGAPVPIRLGEFKPDAQKIGKDVVVLQSGWEAVLENNKQAYSAEFVQRPRFTAAYPATMTPSEFVNKLFTNAGVNPSDTDRSAAVSEFGSAATSVDVAARGRALRRVAENSALARQDFNQAFVLMEYFGYLRRDANSGRDTDFSGYNFWLNKLNTFNGNFRDAEMVKAFLVSTEYRGRFPR